MNKRTEIENKYERYKTAKKTFFETNQKRLINTNRKEADAFYKQLRDLDRLQYENKKAILALLNGKVFISRTGDCLVPSHIEFDGENELVIMELYTE